MKPNFFINCTSIENVKQLYKKLAMQYHPDKGDDTLTMQQINAEYQQILKDKSFSFDNEEPEKDFIIYPEAISKLIILDQVLIYSYFLPGMGENVVFKDHFCQGAKMYKQSFRLGLLCAKW
jgi:hypothetical protein